MYPLLLAVLLSVFSPEPFHNPPPPTPLMILNASYDGTHVEGWDRVFDITPPAPFVTLEEPIDPFRGMGDDVEQWRPLVAGHFSDLGQEAVDMAMRIMACESGGNTHARNPRSSATGLMQIMASVWGEYYGLSRADLESPELNLWVAREVYEQQGWNAWTCWRR